MNLLVRKTVLLASAAMTLGLQRAAAASAAVTVSLAEGVTMASPIRDFGVLWNEHLAENDLDEHHCGVRRMA